MKDLIISQKQFEESRERELKKETLRKEYERQLNEKDVIIYILGLLIAILVIFVGMYLMKDNVKDAYNNCINNGYSATYCAKNS